MTDLEWKHPSFTCPVCGRTSYNPNDLRWGYCGNCHAFTGEAQGEAPFEFRHAVVSDDGTTSCGRVRTFVRLGVHHLPACPECFPPHRR